MAEDLFNKKPAFTTSSNNTYKESLKAQIDDLENRIDNFKIPATASSNAYLMKSNMIVELAQLKSVYDNCGVVNFTVEEDNKQQCVICNNDSFKVYYNNWDGVPDLICTNCKTEQ